MRITKLKSSSGFTIVELMIALSILSVLLITTTLILIQIGSLYSKGVNTADLQSTNRTVVADISGQLQFSGKAPLNCTELNGACYADQTTDNGGSGVVTVNSYCIGHTRYSYILNRELGTDNADPAHPVITQHVLWRDTMKTSATGCPPLKILSVNPPTDAVSNGDGYEVLGNHMRLTSFNIQPVPGSSNIFTLDIGMAFGDTDLLHLPDANGHTYCLNTAGNQFCATSDIATQITGRVY